MRTWILNWRVVLPLAAGTLALLAAPARAGVPAEVAPPLAWSNITAVLDAQPAGGAERDLDEAALLGKTAALPLAFIRAEKDLEGKTRFAYTHDEGHFRFQCFVRGAAANQGSGLVTGRIARVRFVQSDIQGVRVYFLWLEANRFRAVAGK